MMSPANILLVEVEVVAGVWPGGEEEGSGGFQRGDEVKLGCSGTFPYILRRLWGGGPGQEMVRKYGLSL